MTTLVALFKYTDTSAFLAYASTKQLLTQQHLYLFATEIEEFSDIGRDIEDSFLCYLLTQ